MASDPRRAPKCRHAPLVRAALLTRPVVADIPLAIALVTSFDQRSPHRLVVASAESAYETRRLISVTRSVMRPCTSPVRNTVCLSPLLPAARRTCPGSHRSTVIELAMQPTTLPQPTTP